MPNYTSPGVYVEELSTGAKPIQAVGTSTAGFVGEAPSSQARRGKAVAIGNWQQFFREFCGGGTGSAASTPLALAVFGFFQNGGSRCWVVNVKRDDLAKGLEELGRIDEIAIVAAPGWTDIATYSAVLSHCETKGDRVAVLDMPREVDDLEALTRVATAPVPASAAPDSTTTTPTIMSPLGVGTRNGKLATRNRASAAARSRCACVTAFAKTASASGPSALGGGYRTVCSWSMHSSIAGQ